MSACPLCRQRTSAVPFHATQPAINSEQSLHSDKSLPKGPARLIFSAKTWFNTGRNIDPDIVPDKI
jgi:hypothetical protein